MNTKSPIGDAPKTNVFLNKCKVKVIPACFSTSLIFI